MVKLQISNGFVWPVRMFDFVQLCFGESVVQIFDGHLVEGNHVLEFVQLGKKKEQSIITKTRIFDEVFKVN